MNVNELSLGKTDQCSSDLSVYSVKSELLESSTLEAFVCSSKETRGICNASEVVGIRYTEDLRIACAKILEASRIPLPGKVELSEQSTSVLHILRGGLNFGLRDALADAFSWNSHSSIFISAQRARVSNSEEDWHITESNYKKLYLPPNANIVFGDVVATGVSLSHGLDEVISFARDEGVQISSFTFFTIGGSRALEIMLDLDKRCREIFPEYVGSRLFFIEGVFSVPEDSSKQRISISGTDLLRSPALLAPEFVESQYQNPAYPLERCAIYDAGSRAFWIPEYLEDVRSYWELTLELAKQGVSFQQLLGERMPELDLSKFQNIDLESLCVERIQSLSVA